MAQHDSGRRGVVPLRPLSVVLLVVLLAASLAPALVVRQVVHDQEDRLLKERTAEVGQFLQSALTGARTQVAAIGAVSLAAGTTAEPFDRTARPLTQQPGASVTVALLRQEGADWRVVHTLGANALGPDGTVVTGAARLAALQGAAKPWQPKTPAQANDVLVPSKVFVQNGKPSFGWALRAGLSAPGYTVYQEQVLAPFAAADQKTQPDQAFADIVVGVYASPTSDMSQLLLANTRSVPLTGDVGHQLLDIGGSKWLLQVKAKHPLAGSFATVMPWLLLAIGIAFAVLVTIVVEIMARRRRYALDLVEERTAELRSSLQRLEETQVQLVRTERLAAIGELASAVGHELRNPLGVLTNALYLIRTKLGTTAEPVLTRQLDTADREVAAATLIVSDLLEFARARDPIPVNVDLVELVHESIGVAPPPANVAVSVSADPDLSRVSADRDQLRQVLLNLITNAYQAMPDGGRLSISAVRGEGVVRVLVADTGVGMTEETRARLFEPFFTTKARGVGLGLSVCRRIAEAHGGTLEVDSREGEGATFTLALPLVARQRSAPSSARPRSAVSP